MKSYLKYIVLFVILVAIGIVGINLYSNQTLKNINSKTENKQTSNQENNKTLDKSATNSNENKQIATDTAIENGTETKNNSNVSSNESITSSENTTSSTTSTTSNSNSSINQESTSLSQELDDEDEEEDDSIELETETKEIKSNTQTYESYNQNSLATSSSSSNNNTKTDNEENFVIEIDSSDEVENVENTKTIIYPTEVNPTQETTKSKEKNKKNNQQTTTSTAKDTTTTKTLKKITLNKTMITLGLESKVTSLGKDYSTNKANLKVNETLSNDKIIWSVEKGTAVVKVDSNGNITALSGGTALVRASLKSNSDVYADCQVTVVHGLYENVKITSKVTVKDIYTGESITLASGKKVVLLGELKHKRKPYKTRTYKIRIDGNKIAKISGKYLKFLSYYVDDGYTNQVYENFINDLGLTSKTNYLIWVNRGTQRLMLFKKENSKWTLVENFKTSTGDSEGKYTGDSGGSTVTRFNLEVQDFGYDSSLGNIGRVIHVRYETTKKNHGNTMHVGSLPKNTAGGNSSENAPASHGCPHLSTSFRNKLYNTYNGGSKNKLINSKVIYY